MWLCRLSDGSAGGVENGSITHDLCKRYIDKTCLVNEQEIALQISKTLKHEKIIVEGAAAVAIASFTKMRKGKFYIGVMRTDGKGERLLTENYYQEAPSWSPNGLSLIHI